jgi:arylamine N-acetyltransferase
MPMDHETVVAYLDRIGVTAPAACDAAGLRTLHRAHQLTVPFENLSIHLAEPISLDERDLADKIVRRRRGGFCYELNGAFALLLEALGAQVSRVAARVSISGRMLIHTQGGTRTEQQLDTDDALLAAYRDRFGIELSRVPDDPAALRPA